MAADNPITDVTVTSGGLVLTTEAGGAVRAVPWPELASVMVIDGGATLLVFWRPTAEEKDRHERHNEKWGTFLELTDGGYWPGDEDDRPEDDLRPLVTILHGEIMAAWRAWAGQRCAEVAGAATE